ALILALIGYGAADRLREELYDVHFPSGRVAFEEIAILLLDHFGVETERPDARDVLKANIELFKKRTERGKSRFADDTESRWNLHLKAQDLVGETSHPNARCRHIWSFPLGS